MFISINNFDKNKNIAKNIMKRHIESCVTDAIIQGEGQTKIDELIETVFKISNRRDK